MDGEKAKRLGRTESDVQSTKTYSKRRWAPSGPSASPQTLPGLDLATEESSQAASHSPSCLHWRYRPYTAVRVSPGPEEMLPHVTHLGVSWCGGRPCMADTVATKRGLNPTPYSRCCPSQKEALASRSQPAKQPPPCIADHVPKAVQKKPVSSQRLGCLLLPLLPPPASTVLTYSTGDHDEITGPSGSPTPQ